RDQRIVQGFHGFPRLDYFHGSLWLRAPRHAVEGVCRQPVEDAWHEFPELVELVKGYSIQQRQRCVTLNRQPSTSGRRREAVERERAQIRPPAECACFAARCT